MMMGLTNKHFHRGKKANLQRFSTWNPKEGAQRWVQQSMMLEKAKTLEWICLGLNPIYQLYDLWRTV